MRKRILIGAVFAALGVGGFVAGVEMEAPGLASAVVRSAVAPLQAVAHPHPGMNDQVRVYGCPSEDSCRIDFRVENDSGEPVWVIRQARP